MKSHFHRHYESILAHFSNHIFLSNCVHFYRNVKWTQWIGFSKISFGGWWGTVSHISEQEYLPCLYLHFSVHTVLRWKTEAGLMLGAEFWAVLVLSILLLFLFFHPFSSAFVGVCMTLMIKACHSLILPLSVSLENIENYLWFLKSFPPGLYCLEKRALWSKSVWLHSDPSWAQSVRGCANLCQLMSNLNAAFFPSASVLALSLLFSQLYSSSAFSFHPMCNLVYN